VAAAAHAAAAALPYSPARSRLPLFPACASTARLLARRAILALLRAPKTYRHGGAHHLLRSACAVMPHRCAPLRLPPGALCCLLPALPLFGAAALLHACLFCAHLAKTGRSFSPLLRYQIK